VPPEVADTSPPSDVGAGGATTLVAGAGAVPLPAPVEVDITAPVGPVAVPAIGALPAVGSVDVPADPPPAATTLVPPVPSGLPPDDDGPATVGNPPPRTARRIRRQRGRRRLLWFGAIGLALVLVLVTGGLAAAQRIDRPLAEPAQHTGLPVSLVVAGSSPALPWPAKGQGAISVPALGYAQQSGLEAPVPIASLTKLTNALVVLHDHPVPAGASGPMITITPGDAAEYGNEIHNDQSTVPIRTGEQLTERQMLEALLTQSANDIAYSLAIWDSGSIPAFVAKMNAMAASLGAASSHYVDASGYDPHSVSTAADVLRVAAAGMQDPTFAEVVGLKSITFPGIGTVPNVVPEIGYYNVVGVKSGYTSAAGGCMVLAADRTVQGRSVLVLAAVTGQPTPPPTIPPTTTTTAPPPTTTTTTAAPAPGASAPPPTAPPPTTAPPAPTTTTTIPLDDLNVPDPFRYTRPVIEALLGATEGAVVPVAVTQPGQVVGTVAAVWGGATHRVSVVASQGAWLLGWPGQQVAAAATLEPVPPGGSGGQRVGTAHYALGTQTESVPLTLAATVPEPSWWWRLVHG